MNNSKDKIEFNDRYVEKSMKELSFIINLRHYCFKREYIEKKIEYDPFEEWDIDFKYQNHVHEIEQEVDDSENVLDWYTPPVHFLKEHWITKYKVDEIIKKFLKNYNFRQIQNDLILLDRESGNMIVSDRKNMFGTTSHVYISSHFKSKEYKSFRNYVIIPLMVKELYRIVRKPIDTEFYDMNGYFYGEIHIKEPELEIYDPYR